MILSLQRERAVDRDSGARDGPDEKSQVKVATCEGSGDCIWEQSILQEQKELLRYQKRVTGHSVVHRAFRHFLIGRNLKLRQGHNSLKWLFSFKEPVGQLARWVERLRVFEFEMEHSAGKRHGNSDALSWIPCPDPCKHCQHCKTTEKKRLQWEDETLKILETWVERPNLEEISRGYEELKYYWASCLSLKRWVEYGTRYGQNQAKKIRRRLLFHGQEKKIFYMNTTTARWQDNLGVKRYSWEMMQEFWCLHEE